MPKAKITKSLVDQIPYAEKGQILYSDTELPGFYLIVGSRTKTYAAQKDMQGRAVRYTIGRHGVFTPDEARRIAKEKLYLMGTGINPNEQEKSDECKAISLQRVMEHYLTTRKTLKPRTTADYRWYMQSYLSDWMARPIADITKDMIAARHARIGMEHGPYVANKTMRILSAFFNYANATFDICQFNPVLYLTRVKAWYKQVRRQNYIKPQDLPDWWRAVRRLQNDTYRDFLLLLLFTGLRRNEAARLRWADVDFKDKSFKIVDTKNGDPLTLPMSDFVFRLFQNRYQRYGGGLWVFPGPGKDGHFVEPKKGIAKVIADSGVNFSCHDLRRTFVTIAESLDISSYALKRLLNHRMTDVTAGYIIMNVDRLREPVEKISSYISQYAIKRFAE